MFGVGVGGSYSMGDSNTCHTELLPHVSFGAILQTCCCNIQQPALRKTLEQNMEEKPSWLIRAFSMWGIDYAGSDWAG